MATTPRGTISQRIALEGAEEIKRALAEIGQVGERAFAQVQRAVEAANSRLATVAAAVARAEAAFASLGAAAARVGTSVAALGSSFNNFGGALRTTAVRTALLLAGVSAAAFGFGRLVSASAEAGDEVNKVSQSLGLSVEQYQRLGFAAAQAGVDQTQFGRAMTNLNKLIQDGVNEQRKALFDLASGIEQSLSRRGIKSVEDFRTAVGASLSQVADIAKSVQQQLKARGIDLPFGAIFDQLRQMAQGSAEARKQFEQLAGGGFDVARSALQKFGLEVDTSANALQKLRIPVTNADGSARTLIDVIGDVAERFAALPDGVQKSALAVELFGQRVGPRLIPLLNAGRRGVTDLMDEFSRATKGFTKEQAEAAEAMNDSFSSLGTTLRDVRNQIAAPLFVPLTNAARQIQKAIQDNRAAFDQFGDALASRVVPVIEDFVRLITGREAEIQNSWIITLRDGVVELGAAVQGAITNIIIPAFKALQAGAQQVADVINAVFGTELTGNQILVAAAVAKVLGLFGLLAAGVLVAARAVGVLVSGFLFLWRALGVGAAIARVVLALFIAIAGWPALLTAALVAAGVAVFVFWEDIKGAAATAWEFVKQKTTEAWETIKALFSAETLAAVWEAIKQAASDAWDAVVEAASSAWDRIVQAAAQLPGMIVSALSGLVGILISPFQAAADAILGIFGRVMDFIRSVAEAAANAQSNVRGESVGQFASGGYTGNAGTRAIAGFVHGREYVEPAHVVRQPGVLGFLEILRRTGGDLQAAIGRFSRGYLLGGLVDNINDRLSSIMVPGYAGGGLVADLPAPALSNFGTLTLTMGGRRETILTDAEGVAALRRVAIRTQMLSAGRET